MTTPDLTNIPPGGMNIGGGSLGARPQPADPPGDQSSGWLKVGAQGLGGSEFDYGNGYFGPDGPAPWKQV